MRVSVARAVGSEAIAIVVLREEDDEDKKVVLREEYVDGDGVDRKSSLFRTG